MRKSIIEVELCLHDTWSYITQPRNLVVLWTLITEAKHKKLQGSVRSIFLFGVALKFVCLIRVVFVICHVAPRVI